MAITELTAQRNTVGAGQLTTVTFNYPNTPTPGNLLVAGFAWRGDVTITGVPSGWNLAASTGNGTNIDGAIYYKIAGSSEPTTAQWTLSGSQKASGVASEWSGIHATPLDKSNGLNGVAGTVLNTGATGTLSQANELVINLFSSRDTVNFSAFGNSQIVSGTAQSTGGTTASRNTSVLASLVVSATTSVDYGAQIDSAQTWVAAVATFKQAAVTHTASGSLSGQGSNLSSSAVLNVTHEVSSALSGQGSDINGSARRFRHFDAFGNLVASGSNISGEAIRYRSHDSNAELIGQGSELIGSAIKYRSHHADGELVGQGAQLSGDTDRSDSVAFHTAAGDLLGQGATIAGRLINGEIVISGVINADYQTHSINVTLEQYEISAAYETHTIQARL
ncbi:MAG: hypothetical protein K2P74_10345 [Nitrosomonas sp.]|nr:hypothetical protein [Nitrosomonas sp.]